MTKLQETMVPVNGYKTYIAAGLLAVFAISGFLTGYLEADRAIQIALEAAAIAGLRHAIY